MNDIFNGDLFEASLRFINSIHSKTDVIVLVNKTEGVHRSVVDGAYYEAKQIIFLNKIELVKSVNKRYLKFNYYMLKGKKSYIITVTNYRGQYLTLIKWHGYSYKECREDHTEFDYSCNSDVLEIMRRLQDERGK
ncbi:MAG: hypothetical protein AB7E61_06290 [Acholeplasmataceae bacterium]